MNIQQQKLIPIKKIINKRNISGLKKIPTTTKHVLLRNMSNNIGSFLNNTINNNVKHNNNHLNEKNKKMISLKTLKKHFLKGPLIIPNSFVFSFQDNKKFINTNNNKNIYNKYLSNKNSSSDINSIFICNNSISNCNTTCNTHTNSNNKSNSFNKSILSKKEIYKKNSCIKININKNNKDKKLNNLHFISKSNLSLNSIKNDFELKSEKYIQNSEEYIDDILNNILKEEKESEIKINPLYFQFQSDINGKMRAILIDWLIDVHLKFNFKQETLYITIYIIDSYLSLKKIERCNFQLLGVTALFIACKQNEILFRKLNEYVYITDNAYTEEDIKNMENEVLHTLNFNILFPSSLTFYEILCNKLNLSEDKKKFHFGEFLMESFYLDENCLKYTSSTIACAVGYIVMKYFKMENYKECYNNKIFNIKPIKEFIEKYSKSNNYQVYIIKECAKDICFVMNELAKGNLKSTLRKFSNKKYESVTNLLFGNLTLN